MYPELHTNPPITINKGVIRDQVVILCSFGYDKAILSRLKTIPVLRYSNTLRSWYLPYDKSAWASFIALSIEYQISDNIPKKHIPPESLAHQSNGKQIATTDHTTFTQPKSHINCTDISGTAASPTDSDIAGIAPIQSAPTVQPSHGDSKGTDIHQSKGGRSIQLSGTNFYISIHYNDEDIRFLKSLKGFWQSKIKKWIIKASIINLEAIQQKYLFWDGPRYNHIKELILAGECPYLVTLYRSPELAHLVLVQVTGHKSNVSIVKNITDRCYQKDAKRWTIPNDKTIVQRLKEDYIRDGATVIDRLPQDDFDYHKKEESYGQFKTRYLLKTEPNLIPVVERYIDTLIAFKRSHRTMTTYLGPFIKFVKHVGMDNIENISSKAIDKYMATISSQKMSDGYLHNAYNAIMFYYRDVLRKNEAILREAKRPKKDESLPQILSLGEVDRILRALDNLKHTTILYTFYSSGIRLNEILSLRVEDMWWERNQIFY